MQPPRSKRRSAWKRKPSKRVSLKRPSVRHKLQRLRGGPWHRAAPAKRRGGSKSRKANTDDPLAGLDSL